MADLKRTGTNNQKRGVCVLSVPLLEADVIGAGSIYATLPPRSVIKSVALVKKVASATASATLTVRANGANIATNVNATTAGYTAGTLVASAAYLATGGDIEVIPGGTTPAAGDFEGDLVVEYIELDKTTGEYTN